MTYHLPQALIQLKVKEASAIKLNEPIDSPERAVCAVREYLARQDRECVLALFLNAKAKPINWYMVSEGALDQSIVDIRQILKAAILSNAAGLILFHNHPSGETQPSNEDNILTKRTATACKVMGLSLLDHIIIGFTDRYSYKESSPLFLEGGTI